MVYIAVKRHAPLIGDKHRVQLAINMIVGWAGAGGTNYPTKW